MEKPFTEIINEILEARFGNQGSDIFDKSQLLQYISLKTRAANRGAKARGSFANLYAIYVVVEDYIEKGFDKSSTYDKYEGAEFIRLFRRQRELPFGTKLQNHALNNRMNSEFQKFFPVSEYVPILRNLETNRYWVAENMLKIKLRTKTYNIAHVIIEIIDKYAQTKKNAFEQFIQSCVELQDIQTKNPEEAKIFILGLLAPNVDARLFEIVSYAILKYYYHDQKIYWGFEIDKLNEDNLTLYKTGRTNANDGGIDFVMKPLGRFFQVTESLDVKKYFLDIDKVQRYPITFVVKSEEPVENIIVGIRKNASRIYSVQAIVDTYMDCIEEVINISSLRNCFIQSIQQGYLKNIIEEIVSQSKTEFNYQDEIDDKV
ncbi:MAG: restriction endonuclease [Nitrospirae bacterium]|uniref:restriction endonuclease n=1 Tax=Candidatus Magnetominusculus dajiuhuensis TaxID=3137712 RepID=UPI0019E95FDA|nr:restriction endonuclease [Nitrospirota bacterium]